MPTPIQLARTYAGLARLAYAAYSDTDSPMWDGLVEGKRCVAMLTDYLAKTTLISEGKDEYRRLFERIVYGKLG